MAVVVVIVTLCAIALGVSGIVQKRTAVATSRAQIAAICAALENYKSDWGYYPPTFPTRISTDGSAEATNNAFLYNALFRQGKHYLTFPNSQLHGDLTALYSDPVSNIFDVYGKPFNYYCSPKIPFSTGVSLHTGIVAAQGSKIITNWFTAGGQVNKASYDLFSYGPDKITYSGTTVIFISPFQTFPWHLPASANDDITNWGAQ